MRTADRFHRQPAKLYIKTIGEDTAELPLKYFQDFISLSVNHIGSKDNRLAVETAENNRSHLEETLYLVYNKQVKDA